MDMHVCPMQTPAVVPIPHVGGPILPPGQPTVLIAGMPAAVVGDMCICVGPPDVIVMGSSGVMIGGRPAARMGDMTAHGGTIVIGCPTVLIGETGGGGGGGGGAGSVSASAGASARGDTSSTAVALALATAASLSKEAEDLVSALKQSDTVSPRPVDPTKKAWVEVEVVDDRGAPVPYERYHVEVPGGEIRVGWTDANGIARIEGILEGTCRISLPDRDEKSWDPV